VELLKKFIEDVGKDLVLDDFNLKEAQMRLPARKHFWVARLMEAKIKRGELLNKKKTLKKTLTKGVIETSPVKISQAAAESAAERHDAVQELTSKIYECNMIIEYLEKVEKVMGQMGFDIKNIIDVQKMEQL
jgi:hypothetical protein|tara:strand:+ start:638 stop:1033 length:396 start_codon:yes stop_codon:yes gene_type:complete